MKPEEYGFEDNNDNLDNLNCRGCLYKLHCEPLTCISKQKVKDIIHEQISCLEDLKGVGVPAGTDYSAIDHTIQTLYYLLKELNLEELDRIFFGDEE